MARDRFGDNEEAVSEIVGELLVLFITVAIFGLLIVAVNAMMTAPHTDIVTIGVANNTTAVTVTHMGGDSVPYGSLSVIVNGAVAGATITDANGNGLWDIGETICVPNPPANQRLDVIVYDTASGSVLGDYTLR